MEKKINSNRDLVFIRHNFNGLSDFRPGAD